MQLNLFTQNKKSKFVSLAAETACDISQSGWPDVFGKNFYDLYGANTRINTLSLFSGAGGLDIGFHDVGFNIVERIEIEPVFCKTLRSNTGVEHYFEYGRTVECDIRHYTPVFDEKIDFIIGGPPCQSFSAAGRRANGVSGINDDRGTLFKEYVRLLNHIKPFGFMFENVYGITGAQNGKAWEKIRSGFSEAGYSIFFRILDAADYGVPQHRERLIIVGVKEGTFRFPKPTHGPDSVEGGGFYNAGCAIASLPANDGNAHIGGRFGSLLDAIPPGLNYSFYTEEMGHPRPIFAWRSKFSDFMYKADPDTPVRTIKAQGGQYTGPFHWTCRHFTIDEYKRLQTFPDRYKLEGNNSEKIRQIGNSVPPQLARILAIAIRGQFFSSELSDKLDYLDDWEELGFRKRKRELTRIYQEKARNAIKTQPEPEAINLGYDKDLYLNISKDFKISLATASTSRFYAEKLLSDMLVIKVYDNNTKADHKVFSRFSITTSIRTNACRLPFNIVKMEGFSIDPLSFTVAWKIFEQLLAKNHLKADLVQLNGYYQYDPNMSCKITCPPDSPLEFLVPVVEGRITRKLLDTKSLLHIWSANEEKLRENALMMRRLGYEIRNHKTNPQIPKDCWLIPYAFPTLNPLSVQLRKSIC